MGPRKPSGWFWLVVLLTAAPLLYILSFAPACALVSRHILPFAETARFYRPLVRAATCDLEPVAAPLRWYAEAFVSETYNFDTEVLSPLDLMAISLELDEYDPSR